MVKRRIKDLIWKLKGRTWIARPFYWQDKKGIYCEICHDYIEWEKKGDLDIHDMEHWD